MTDAQTTGLNDHRDYDNSAEYIAGTPPAEDQKYTAAEWNRMRDTVDQHAPLINQLQTTSNSILAGTVGESLATLRASLDEIDTAAAAGLLVYALEAALRGSGAATETLTALRSDIDAHAALLASDDDDLDSAQERTNKIKQLISDIETIAIVDVDGLEAALNGKEAAGVAAMLDAALQAQISTLSGTVATKENTGVAAALNAAMQSQVNDLVAEVSDKENTGVAASLDAALQSQIDSLTTSVNGKEAQGVAAGLVATLQSQIDSLSSAFSSNDAELDTAQERVDRINQIISDIDTLAIFDVSGLPSALNDLQTGIDSKENTGVAASLVAAVQLQVNSINTTLASKENVGVAAAFNSAVQTQLASKENVGVAAALDSILEAAIRGGASTETLATLRDDINAITQILSSDDTSLDTAQERVDRIKQLISDVDTLGIGDISGLAGELSIKLDWYDSAKAAAGEYVQGQSWVVYKGYLYLLNTDVILQAARGNTDSVDQTVLPDSSNGGQQSMWVRRFDPKQAASYGFDESNTAALNALALQRAIDSGQTDIHVYGGVYDCEQVVIPEGADLQSLTATGDVTLTMPAGQDKILIWQQTHSFSFNGVWNLYSTGSKNDGLNVSGLICARADMSNVSYQYTDSLSAYNFSGQGVNIRSVFGSSRTLVASQCGKGVVFGGFLTSNATAFTIGNVYASGCNLGFGILRASNVTVSNLVTEYCGSATDELAGLNVEYSTSVLIINLYTEANVRNKVYIEALVVELTGNNYASTGAPDIIRYVGIGYPSRGVATLHNNMLTVTRINADPYGQSPNHVELTSEAMVSAAGKGYALKASDGTVGTIRSETKGLALTVGANQSPLGPIVLDGLGHALGSADHDAIKPDPEQNLIGRELVIYNVGGIAEGAVNTVNYTCLSQVSSADGRGFVQVWG